MADDRFLQMFFEEARELLLSLEEGLMDLERRQSDRAHLDRTFRAAHSIKGAAAMVGLGAIAEFTHLIEAVLDRIRSASLPIDSDVISTLLDGRDHLSTAVEAEANRSPIPAPSELVRRLSALLRDPNVPTPAPIPAPPSPRPGKPPTPDIPAPPSAGSPSPKPKSSKKPAGEGKAKARGPRGSKKASPLQSSGVESAGGVGSYRITLKPGPELLRRGVNPIGVLDELREFGPTQVSTDPDLVPPLEEMDPERCYLAWTIEVATDVPPDRLDDVFLFVAEDSTVTIERRSSEGTVLPPPTVESIPIPEAPSAQTPLAVVPEPSPPPVVIQTNGTATSPASTAKPTVPNAVPTIPRMSTRIRVDAGQLDDLVGLAGELAVLSDNLQGVREQSAAEPWIATLEALDRVSRLIRDTTLELRMVPVEELFSRFPRVVRDLADRFGKEIDLRIIGQETRLDRTIVERLSDPMIHLIRNAVDHALETPAERIAAGKSRAGRITLWAGHEGDRVALRIEDDGRGLDRVGIVKKGIAKGLVPVGTSPDDPRVDTLIFEPGFSTRDAVSELSGRGVGLDVVRDAVRSLRGSLGVESHPGKGTAFIFRLPLTLALIDGLLVETGGGRYVVPLAQVEECVALNGASPALSRGRPCVSIRGELVPLVQLREVFHAEGQRPARQELLLTRHAGQRVGVAVDRLLGRVQAVIQALGEGLTGLNRFSGATILGDGSVSLILDLAALVSESRAADSHTYHTLPAGVTSEAYR
jgi:two-component system, chemotaxis family, sensor kinase CheA